MNDVKKILIVAMPESIHTARWLAQIIDQGWEIHLFPSIDVDMTHPMMSDIIVHHSVYFSKGVSSTVEHRGIPVPFSLMSAWSKDLLARKNQGYRIQQLKKLIDKLKPDVVHSLEIQHAGYLTLEAKKLAAGPFPPWIATNWGSDIYLFGRLPWHEGKIREVLSQCNYYSCECRRDVCLAKHYGFKGIVLPVFPNTGGFDLAKYSAFRKNGPVSERRSIMLKGYQGWAGRALVGLRALERCADILKGYQIFIHSAMCDEVVIAAELFKKTTSIPVEFVTPGSSHERILQLHGESRLHIGLSVSDGISTSLLEAMLMGSFPIQSFTACADEWVVDGKSGILVHPDDPDNVEAAIRKALSDDNLVNSAAEYNCTVVSERLDDAVIKGKTVEFYKYVLEGR